MKKIITLASLLFIATNLFAQVDVAALKAQLAKEVDSLRMHKPLDDYNGGWIAQLEKNFYIDTYYVEHLWMIDLEEDGSTMGIVSAAQRAEDAYDALLNKYYKKLLTILNTNDKNYLKTSQRNWIKFRDAEKELNYTLYKEEYSGGGTIHKIFVSHKNVDITKTRVIELYNLLDRIWK